MAQRKLRIVYLWDADYPWDVRTQKVCSALTEGGHEVHIVARNKAWSPVSEDLPEGTVHRLHPWRWLGRGLDGALSFPAFFSPRWARRLRSVMDRVSADLIIVRDLPLCPTAIWAGARGGIPVVLDMAENYGAMIQETWDAGRQRPWDVLVRNPSIIDRVEQWCLSRLDAIVVVVEESGERLEALGVPSSKITVVSNTPPRARASGPPKAARDPKEPLELVYLGLMEIPRGVGELLDAMAMVLKEGAPVRLTVVGGGRDEALLRERARRLELPESGVRFTGWLEHADALKAVAEAQVGIVPHHADDAWNTTIPNKLFDYMASGLAVISSDAVPPTRVLRETGAGVTFASGSAESLADAIRKLTDPAVQASMGQAGRQAVQERFNWENDSAALLRAVDRIVPGSPGTA